MNTIGLSIREIRNLFEKKIISAEENVRQRLELIKRINPEINAIIQCNEEDALSQARFLDAEQKKGKKLGPLHGVIFTVKDIYRAKKYKTTGGCKGLENAPEDKEDATIIDRLKKAGAIFIGKTNTPEFENSADTDNDLFGPTLNPYNTKHSAGGSSGGSGAAVAACLSDFDIGADHGGSIRIPADYCGVTAIRCTPHRIPSTGYFAGGVRRGYGSSVNTEAPIARYVDDLAIIVNAIQGPDGKDSSVENFPLLDDESLEKLIKVAYFDNDGISNVMEEDVKIAVKNAADALASPGVIVEPNKPPRIEDGFEIYKKIFWPLAADGFNELFEKYHVKKPSKLIRLLMQNFEKYKLKGNTKEEKEKDFKERCAEQEFFKKEMEKFFETYDAFICPVTATDALPIDQPMWDGKIEYLRFCWETSAAGLPAVVVRAGTSKNNLPIGIQIVTKPGNEKLALALAKIIEKKLGHWQMPEMVADFCKRGLDNNDNEYETSMKCGM